MNRRLWIASALLIAAVLVAAGGLAAWKVDALAASQAASAHQAEPMEAVSAAVARRYQSQATTTAIGTVLATRSVTLRNELAGTVAQVALVPGRIVEAGAVLVRLDVSVEEAERAALAAQAQLAATVLERNRQASRDRAVSELEVDRAQAELEVLNAQIARTEAIIARKTLRAPFRARVGLADVHRGQFLDAGTELTTLQGVDEIAHVDFSVAQAVGAGLAPGDRVEVHGDDGREPLVGALVAIDSRVDPTTRTALARARIDVSSQRLAPGASVRVEVPVGAPRPSVVVPASAVRRGPEGDHVFVLAQDPEGQLRANRRFVETGPAVGNQVEIRHGLAAGEQVAAAGSFKLREAVRVIVQEEQTASLAPAR